MATILVIYKLTQKTCSLSHFSGSDIWVQFSRVALAQAAVRVISEGLTGIIYFHTFSRGHWQYSVPVSCWGEELPLLAGYGQKSSLSSWPSGPLQRVLTTWQLAFPRVFCNPISGVASHYSCHILFISSKPLDAAHT